MSNINCMKISDINTIFSKKIIEFEKNGTRFKFLIRCVKYNSEETDSESDSDTEFEKGSGEDTLDIYINGFLFRNFKSKWKDYFYYIDQIEGRFNPPLKNKYDEETDSIGNIISKNFFTTKMLDIAYSKNISLRNKRKSIKTLLEKVSKVPEHRTGLAFHSIMAGNYPFIAEDILKTLNLKLYKTNEDIQIFILKTLCEDFWD